jgi:L-ascorbate metabolism protein UlaG (beta-lactamase superfamily)
VPDTSVSDVDCVLISHLHRDHCDITSLRRLRRRTRLLVPRGAAPMLRKAGFKNVEEFTAGETAEVGALTIRAIAADHSGFRPPFGPRAEALGYLVEGSATVYFAGDTARYAAMTDLAGSVDVALLPVWGWGPNLRGGHMDPAEAAQALSLVAPRIGIPIHWGTYYPVGMGRFRPHVLHRPPEEFVAAARDVAPGVSVEVLGTGDRLRWPA